jgi:hypothetical protein
MAFKQVLKSVDELPRRIVRFAELLASGKTPAEAGKEVGYSASVVKTTVYRYIRKTRESSQYPLLWDYYEELRKEKLRLFDVKVDTIVNELKIVAFSDISNYLDLPSRELHEKHVRLTDKMLEIEQQLEVYNVEISKCKKAKKDKEERELIKAIEISEEAKPLIEELKKVRKQIRKLEDSPGYYLRLRYKEDIPKELLPDGRICTSSNVTGRMIK